MLDFAQDLTTKNDKFTGEVGGMARDVDAAMDSWQGKGAAAAAERALAHELSANHLSETVVSLIDHTNAFGTELLTHRTSLLDIVDREVKQAGMTYDDNGNVTAPKYPQGGPDSATFRLLQQIVDGRAAGLQSRIKALLTKFGDAERKAAQAITSDMRLLRGYEKSPDKAPIGPRVQSILDEKTLLPTDPKQLHDFWQTLTPAEKDALWQHDKNIGNLDGLPAADRDHYNRMNLDYQLSRAQAGDPKYKDKLDDLTTLSALLADKDKQDRYLLLFDTESGKRTHAAVAAGNPDTADHVTTYVPGTKATVSSMTGDMNERVEGMRDQARKNGAANPSGIAWFGYDTPPTYPDASHLTYAENAADALDKFQTGLRVSHDGPPSYNAVVGHSYGTTVIGYAASHGHSLDADAVVFVGSPGTAVQHASDLNLTGVPHNQVANHVYATSAYNDPVSQYGGHGVGGILDEVDRRLRLPVPGPYGGTVGPPADQDFGPDPTQKGYGAQVFHSDIGSIGFGSHSEYWDTHNRSLHGLGSIVAGHGVPADDSAPTADEDAQRERLIESVIAPGLGILGL